MSDLDYPRMMYRKGGQEQVFGLECETSTVEDAEDERAAREEGWHRTPFEAHGIDEPKADVIEESSPLDVEKEALSGEIAQLSQDLETVQNERFALTEELSREREARKVVEAQLAETEALLAEATKPVEPPKKETLSMGGKGGK